MTVEAGETSVGRTWLLICGLLCFLCGLLLAASSYFKYAAYRWPMTKVIEDLATFLGHVTPNQDVILHERTRRFAGFERKESIWGASPE